MKNIISGLFIVVITVALCDICCAEQINPPWKIEDIDKAERECISKTADTLKMNKCSAIARQAWQEDIKKSMAELKKILSSDNYNNLQQSQAAWQNYKLNEYKLMESVVLHKKGTMFSNTCEGWKTELVKQRAIMLREYLDTLNFEY